MARAGPGPGRHAVIGPYPRNEKCDRCLAAPAEYIVRDSRGYERAVCCQSCMHSYLPEFEDVSGRKWQPAEVICGNCGIPFHAHREVCGEWSEGPSLPELDAYGGFRDELWTLPGHPVKAGAGYDCNCGACLSLPARRHEGTPPPAPDGAP